MGSESRRGAELEAAVPRTPANPCHRLLWRLGRWSHLRDPGGPDTLRWFWSMTVNGPMTRSDRVAILEEAKAQFRRVGNLEGVGELGRGALTSLSFACCVCQPVPIFCEFSSRRAAVLARSRLVLAQYLRAERWPRSSSLQSVRMNFIRPQSPALAELRDGPSDPRDAGGRPQGARGTKAPSMLASLVGR